MRKFIERPEYVYENLERLAEILEERGIKRRDVSDRLGIAYGLFMNWVKGYTTPSKENYNKLAEYFDWRLW